MRFGSVCSGIEAASVAWHPLGWKAAWLAEIEPFPCAVLAHHYHEVPNLGDMTTIRARIEAGEVEAPDLLCGGTPCQAFSVAGLRRSLDDERGNLSLEFIRIADAIDRVRRTAGRSPSWIVWENVPGVLSTHDNAFGAFVGGLAGSQSAIPAPAGGWPRAGVVAGPGRVVAWRVLDAQHFGLAQRRQRVFVLALGGAGRWACADALLPVSDRMRWHPAPSRQAGQGVAGTLSARTQGGGFPGTDGACGGHVVPFQPIAPTLNAAFGQKLGLEDQHIRGGAGMFVAHSRRGEGFDASEDGTGRGVPLVPVGADCWNGELTGDVAATMGTRGSSTTASGPTVLAHAFDARQSDVLQYGNQTGPLDTDGHSVGVLAFSAKDHGGDATQDLAPTLRAGGHTGSHANAGVMPAVQQAMQVRRLTPEECEALQGFLRRYTAIPYRGKPAADGPRYKALGNSWAVPCARWIGQQINKRVATESAALPQSGD